MLAKDRHRARLPNEYVAASFSDDRDSRNGSSKPRYLDPPAETRFSERPNVAAAGSWSSGASHPTFGLPSNEIWAPKQAESSAGAWRGMDDSRYERPANNDRKPVIPSASNFFDSSSIRANQFIGGGSNIIPGVGRFAANHGRYDNGGRF